jgi:hypothetical protein
LARKKKRMTMKKRLISIAGRVAVLMVLAASACEDYNTERGRGDAPVGHVYDEKVDVIQFPDQFSNIATTCDHHGNRLYMTTGGDFIAVVQDEECSG